MITAITLFSVLMVWGSAAWVYWDATGKKIGKIPGEKGFTNMSAGVWGTATALLWVVGFPIYLSKRSSLIERAKTQPIEVKRRWLKLSIFLLLGAFGVYGSFADPTTDASVAKRSAPDAKPQNVPAVHAPQVKPAQTPTASTTGGAQPAPAAVTTSVAPMENKANATPPASVPPTQVTAVPRSKPVAALPAATASAAEVEAKARAREELAAQRRATMEREQEEKRRSKATQSACVYKPVMTDEDLAKCR